MCLTRLKVLREERGLSRIKLAKMLGISNSLYGKWENDYENIPTSRLNDIANYYEINIDYILKLTDKREKVLAKNIDLKKTSIKIKKIRDEYNYSLRKMASMLNTSNSTWSAYETGKTLILSPFLLKICKNKNYSVDWILDKSKTKYRNE